MQATIIVNVQAEHDASVLPMNWIATNPVYEVSPDTDHFDLLACLCTHEEGQIAPGQDC